MASKKETPEDAQREASALHTGKGETRYVLSPRALSDLARMNDADEWPGDYLALTRRDETGKDWPGVIVKGHGARVYLIDHTSTPKDAIAGRMPLAVRLPYESFEAALHSGWRIVK